MRAGQASGAAGTVGQVITFRNLGTRTCQLYGYPGVAGLDGAGRQVLQATRLKPPESSVSFPAQTVTLAPGQYASALITASDMPRANATSCPHYTLLVTPPGETHSVAFGHVSLPDCAGFGVNPVVAGSTGTG